MSLIACSSPLAIAMSTSVSCDAGGASTSPSTAGAVPKVAYSAQPACQAYASMSGTAAAGTPGSSERTAVAPVTPWTKTIAVRTSWALARYTRANVSVISEMTADGSRRTSRSPITGANAGKPSRAASEPTIVPSKWRSAGGTTGTPAIAARACVARPAAGAVGSVW